MRVTKYKVELDLQFLESAIKQHKDEVMYGKPTIDSKSSLLDKSIFILGDIQLLSPDFEIDREDPLFKKLAKLQYEIMQLSR